MQHAESELERYNHYKVLNTHSLNSMHSELERYNHYKVLNTYSLNSMQSLQGVKYTRNVNSMQPLQGVKYTQCELHAIITGENLTCKFELELTFNCGILSKKNQITSMSQREIKTTFPNFLHSKKS